MAARGEAFNRLVAVWNGEAEIADLDRLVAPAYVGHIRCRDRDLVRLKADIVAYRAATPNVVFRVEHQFGQGETTSRRDSPRRLSIPAGDQRRQSAG